MPSIKREMNEKAAKKVDESENMRRVVYRRDQ